MKSATTGIGSLPHHNIDSALAYSFKHGIPFLPQTPLRNPWEYMIAQALEDLPGLRVERDGEVFVNPEIWASRAAALNQRLTEAFAKGAESPRAFEDFEPSSATSSSWQAFLWELQESGAKLAKIQIAGPMTAQWALRTQTGTSLDKFPDIGSQIFRLVLARSFAMIRKLQAASIQPILFLDEPGLYAYSADNPKHLATFHELKLLIQTLRKEGATVGLHCCSNTDWRSVLSMDLSILSLDTSLSLESLLLVAKDELVGFLNRGGRLSLGVIPTGRSSALHSLDASQLFDEVQGKLSIALGESMTKRVLSEALYTPACGLALQSIPDTELILDSLNEFIRFAHQG